MKYGTPGVSEHGLTPPAADEVLEVPTDPRVGRVLAVLATDLIDFRLQPDRGLEQFAERIVAAVEVVEPRAETGAELVVAHAAEGCEECKEKLAPTTE